jgi:L-histidine N-alpha-methyltransferase
MSSPTPLAPIQGPAPRFIETHSLDARALAAEAAGGLLAPRAIVAPKFFYDALGSRLFEAITELDEYYLTRTEASIFARHGPAIAAALREAVGEGPTMVDLGAGNCAKAAALFGLIAPRRYLAVDIAIDHLRATLPALARAHPAIAFAALGQDFATALAIPAELLGDAPALVFYPGSSIGNFGPDDALRLLREARAVAEGGALLIGVDLVKDQAVLERAYDDPLGVTAAFNLNLLRHLNRLLGADFDLRQWRHVAFYEPVAGRIEMHLQAREALRVRWPGAQRDFAAGERIHTENSHKWTIAGFEALLARAGFGATRCWCDEAGWFAVFLARHPDAGASRPA